MSEEYHVIAIPLFGWETCTPKNLSELKTLMTAANRLFSFKPLDMNKSETENKT